MRTAIVSDIHLGCNASHIVRFLNFLHHYPFDELIITGDLIHSHFIVNDAEINILHHLRHITHNRRVIWVRGNHDPVSSDLAELIGAKWYTDYYEWEDTGNRFVAIHGHQYDTAKGVLNLTWLGALTTLLIARNKPRFSSWLMRFFTQKSTCRKVEQGSINFGLSLGVCAIFAGHTHRETKVLSTPYYFNLGSWCNKNCLIGLIENGKVTIQRWNK